MTDAAAMTLDDNMRQLEQLSRGASAQDLLRQAIHGAYRGHIALVSSFGTEAAALLHIVASIDRDTPVIFLDTQKLFPETLRYRDTLIERLGLTSVRTITPDAEAIANEDADGMLWQRDPDRCCALRKVAPLENALDGFDAWINGRKRSHGDTRSELPMVEIADGRLKLNPLAMWTADDIDAYFAAHDLPRHPLEANGFSSIGCMPCSAPTRAGEGRRAGRWRGLDKTECGIHGASFPAPRGEA
jgi:phosphoadenosine phosphosulfate reductase